MKACREGTFVPKGPSHPIRIAVHHPSSPSVSLGRSIMPSKALRILTLDGAGIKGLSELFILQHLFDKVKGITGLTDIQPCDVFDLIAGSSTGGLNAIFLGRMVMSIEDAITAYESVGKKVFVAPKTAVPTDSGAKQFLKKLAAGPTHSKTRVLMESMMGVLADRAPMGGGDLAARLCVEDKIADQEYDDDHSWRVMLTVTRKATNEPDLLRNWRTGTAGQRNYSCAVWEAAGAVCAMPTYFPDHVRFELHGDKLFGVGRDRANPVREALAEMKREKSFANKSVACLVSVGAGKVQPDSLLDGKLEAAVDMMVGAEEEAEKFTASKEGDDLKTSGRYFRFNPPLNMQELIFDECNENESVKAAIDKYIQQPNNQKMFEECAQLLASTVRVVSGKVK